MDQPYTKENIEAAMGYVRTLLDNVNALETMFPGRHFTLDGHLVGSVGEVAAAYHYGIKLFPPSTELHDGYIGDRNVQIKITQTENVLIGEKPEYLIVLYLARAGKIYEVYNGPGIIPWKVPGKPDKRGYKHLRVNKLMSLDKDIKPEERITAVHPIEKLTPEQKNHRTTRPDTRRPMPDPGHCGAGVEEPGVSMKEKHLPGRLGDRVRELREWDKLTQGELAARIGTSASTLSRIEKGEIESPGSDIVVKLVQVFRVSTDFLLGVTDYPDRKNYEVGQFGLSPEAARRLNSGEVDMNALNRMVMNPCFPTVSRNISSYLDGSLEAGMRIQNDMIASAMDMVRPFPTAQSALSAMRLPASLTLERLVMRMELMLRSIKRTRVSRNIPTKRSGTARWRKTYSGRFTRCGRRESRFHLRVSRMLSSKR